MTLESRTILEKKNRSRATWCSFMATFLFVIMFLLAFLISSNVYGQPSTYSVEGVSTTVGKFYQFRDIIGEMRTYNTLQAGRIKISYHSDDSTFTLRLDPLSTKTPEGFDSTTVSAIVFNSLLEKLKSEIDQENVEPKFNIQDSVQPSTENIKDSVLEPSGIIIESVVLIVLMLLCAVAIRYFILLSVHYRSRADALALIDPATLISVENALLLTSSSNIDFRISKNTKNELAELVKLKVESQRKEQTFESCRPCCHPCCCIQSKSVENKQPNE